MSILIRYGVNNSVSKPVGEFPTVSSVLTHSGLRQFLAFGDNVEARIDGVAVDGGTALKDGDTIDIVSRANTKGKAL
jgi:molybdopterin converting factor small subunit